MKKSNSFTTKVTKNTKLIVLLPFVLFVLFVVGISSAHAQATVMVNTNTGVVLFPTNLFSANGINTGTDTSNQIAAVAAAGVSNATAIAALTGQVATASTTISSNSAAIATLTNQVAAISMAGITNAVALQGPSNSIVVASNRLYITFSTNVAAAGGGILTLTNGNTATTAGYVYQLAASGVWQPAVNTNAAQCSRLLAIATGTNSSLGMLRIGLISVTPSTSLSPGGALFVDAVAGQYTQTVPTNSTAQIRALGHATATNVIFFAPDAIWGQVQ